MSKWVNADEIEKLMKCGCAYAIRELPSIDLVTCAECRYEDMELCPMYKLVRAGVRKPDDFCSYGERSEGE